MLRVNIDADADADAGAGVRRVADTVKEIAERTGIDHFMIDSMYDVHTAEGSVEHARQLLGLVEKG